MKRKILTLAMIVITNMASFAQMPACITIDPPNASAYDSITLTFDPALSCYLWNSLTGSPVVYMYSGVCYETVNWQFIIPHNGSGANGQSPLLTNNPNGTYSMHFRPSDYYGFPAGMNITRLCVVFNDGVWGSRDGRDFVPGYSSCQDIFIPLQFGPPRLHFTVNMQKAYNAGIFDPTNDHVFIAIANLDTLELVQGSGSDLMKYSIVVKTGLDTGITYNYKYRINETDYENIIHSVTASPGYTYVDDWWNNEEDPGYNEIIADFEDGTTGRLTLHVMGCGEWDDVLLHPVSETFSIIENPFPSIINPSDKVMQFTRRGLLNGGLRWGGFWANCFPSLNVTEKKYVHAKAWKPRISPLRFKLEAGTNGTLEVINDNPQMATNDWEEYIFDFQMMTGTYPLVGFMPDYEYPFTLNNDIIIYFDDFVLSDSPYPVYVPPDRKESTLCFVYPNPVTDKITVEIPESFLQGQLSITNIKGQQLITRQISDNKTKLDISNLPSGVYFVRVTGERTVQVGKFMKN